MSRRANVVRHGYNHLPGGSDPIPGFGNSVLARGSFTSYVLSFSSLLAYWRLGEAASPFLDTSGRYPASPSNAIQVDRGSGADLVTDQTGALPTVQDDGAIEFNSNGVAGDYLDVSVGTADFDFQSAVDPFTVAAWVKVKADTGTFTGAIISNRFSSPPEGWGLFVDWPARTVTWYRKDVSATLYTVTSPSLTADTWYLIVGVYDGAGTMELFIDGASVGSTATTGGLPNWNNGPQIGGGAPNGSTDYYFYGTIDEVAIWDAALTPTEVGELWARGGSESVAAQDKVWTAQGDGTADWQYPIVVEF